MTRASAIISRAQQHHRRNRRAYRRDGQRGAVALQNKLAMRQHAGDTLLSLFQSLE